jgi:enamine deaminase RidA (YjgF/YER057c/UK114 family)
MPVKTKPAAIAKIESPDQPYSTCVEIGGHLYFSGVVAITSDKKPDGHFEQQVVSVLEKMVILLRLSGLTVDHVYKATAMLVDPAGVSFFNRRWSMLFGDSEIKPTRKTFGVAWLPFGCAFEVEFEAIRPTAVNPAD